MRYSLEILCECMHGRELEKLQSSAHFTLNILFFTANFKRNVEKSGLKTTILQFVQDKSSPLCLD